MGCPVCGWGGGGGDDPHTVEHVRTDRPGREEPCPGPELVTLRYQLPRARSAFLTIARYDPPEGVGQLFDEQAWLGLVNYARLAYKDTL